MNIGEKLALSARQGKITLLREGMFLRCYEESLYTLVHSAYPTLNILSRTFKNLNGRRVLYGGFPESQLSKVFPGAVEVAWGHECDCHDMDRDKYRVWWNEVVHEITERDREQSNEGVQILLDGECCRFLASWQPEAFPAAVDAGFIAAIKKKVGA